MLETVEQLERVPRTLSINLTSATCESGLVICCKEPRKVAYDGLFDKVPPYIITQLIGICKLSAPGSSA